MASGVLTYDAFVCNKCGVCCKKQKAVLLTVYDIFRLSDRLGSKPNDFFKRYCTRSTKFNSNGLKRFYLRANGGCPFLKDNICTVQDVKPVVCARNPFYYIEASLASYKVFGILEDECCINEFSYDTMTKGETERLIDMDIFVKATDDYIEKYGRFDEKTAKEYYDISMAELTDPGLRALTEGELLDQSVRREEMCRADPYYKGATNMYLGGFYDDFKREVWTAKERGNAIVFEPSALGTIDNIMALVLFENDHSEVKKTLAQSQGSDIHTKMYAFEGREYLIISINAKNGKNVLFYYHIEPEEKKGLRHAVGELTFNFKSEKGGSIIFKGRDADGWLS